MKKYTFDLAPNKGHENKLIIVEAENEKMAKDRILAKLYVLNKKFIRVYEYEKGKK